MLKKTTKKKTIYPMARVICFNRWGYRCLNVEKSSKTAAIAEGRKMKRDGWAFSYIVYENDKIVARG